MITIIRETGMEEEVVEIVVKRERGRPRLYPFLTMAVGDQFYVHRDREGRNQFNKVHAAKNYWERQLRRRFEVRAVSVGLRVQRVE
jgi:hypothetical protein